MTQRDSALFKTGWISLAIIGLAILLFGLITALMPASSGPPYLRAIGVASIGMGLFGLLITTIAYRRRERWAWFALWYYTKSACKDLLSHAA
jgi:multisubunit Na+/H+ antiporter MnhB subunit